MKSDKFCCMRGIYRFQRPTKKKTCFDFDVFFLVNDFQEMGLESMSHLGNLHEE